MKAFLRRLLFAAPVAAAGMVLGLTLPSGGALDGPVGRPERELAEAQQVMTFGIRLPSWLPAGSALERVSWPELLPDEERTWTAVDVWYRLPTGERLHIWETDGPALEKNPIGRGEEHSLGRRTWWREVADLGTVFTTMSSDGVTLQVSAAIDDETLERIAQSLGA